MRRLGVVCTALVVACLVSAEAAWACKLMDGLFGRRCCARIVWCRCCCVATCCVVEAPACAKPVVPACAPAEVAPAEAPSESPVDTKPEAPAPEPAPEPAPAPAPAPEPAPEQGEYRHPRPRRRSQQMQDTKAGHFLRPQISQISRI